MINPGSKMQAFVVPKTRKPRFEVRLKIIDLNNIPYINGKSFVKWHLHQSASTENGGRTEKVVIKDHKAIYDYEYHTAVRMVVDKNYNLQESPMQLEVFHEVLLRGKEEKSLLGFVKVNLAEYVEPSAQNEEGVARRHLLQESKINSTLKIDLHIRQIEGERNYDVPTLKSAPVFVGIAGFEAGEQVDTDESGKTPAVTGKSREMEELERDLYLKILAAESTREPWQLRPDEAIEDIFNGGDGFGSSLNRTEGTHDNLKVEALGEPGSLSEGEANPLKRNKRSWPAFPGFLTKRSDTSKQDVHDTISKTSGILQGGMTMQSHLPFAPQSHDQPKLEGRKGSSQFRELEEWEVRDDMRCWTVREPPS